VHDHPAPAEFDYAWPACSACGKDLWTAELGRFACWPCENKTAARIAELPGMFQKLDTTAALMRGSRSSGGLASGSKTPPIPPRLEVLALVGPGGIAARLSAIEDSWRKAFNRRVATWAGSPREAVPAHAHFLAINLRRACEEYESVGQDIDDLRRLHGECKALVEQKPRAGQVKIGLCPAIVEGRRCFEQLYASTRSFKTACPKCGAAWEGEEEWRDLREVQQRALTEAAGLAA